MLPVGADFLKNLRGSGTPTLKVEAWYGGRCLVKSLPVVGGSLSVTAGQQIRSRLTLEVADPSNTYDLRPDGPLSAYGAELRVRMGLSMGAYSKDFQMGCFPIVDAEHTAEWAFYHSEWDPATDKPVPRGAITKVECTDRAQIVGDARFLARTQPRFGTVKAEIARLLKGVAPWGGSTLPDRSIPSDLTYDDDRLKAITDLADVLDADFIFTELGVGALQSRARAPFVWEISDREDGVRVSMTNSVSRDNMYNAVIARSSGTGDDVVLQGAAYTTDGVLRHGGPFGSVPYFYSSPVLTTQSQVNAAARTTLARLQRDRAQTIPVTCISNPALQVHDVVRLPTPRGFIDGEVRSATWPLTGGIMSMSVAVDPIELAAVA